jgi:serine/threonine protein kinase
VERTLFVVKSEPISRHADKALVEQSILKRLSDLYHAQRAQTADSVARDVVAALHGTKIDADTRQREIDVAVATEVASFDVAWPFPLYYDAWTCGGRSHVLMEYVEGRTLQRFADELRAADTAAFYYSQTRQHETTRATALEPLRVAMRRVHDACAELDRRGVVHQDLHDGNVMVSTRGARAGAITVIDFGQAVQRDDVVAGTNFEHFMWQLVARGHLPEEVAYAWLAEYDDTEYLRRLRLNVLRFHDTVLFDEYYTYGMMNYALFAFDHRRETLGALFDDATSSLYLRVPRLRSRTLVTDGDAFDRFWRTLSSRLAAVSTSVPNRAMNKWRYIPVRERTQPPPLAPPATTVVPAKRPLQTATTATTTTVSEPP